VRIPTAASTRPLQTANGFADFTYVWTAEGWLYVAAVVDLFSRRVVGWSMSTAMKAQFVADARSTPSRISTLSAIAR
jgi:putative transposase